MLVSSKGTNNFIRSELADHQRWARPQDQIVCRFESWSVDVRRQAVKYECIQASFSPNQLEKLQKVEYSETRLCARSDVADSCTPLGGLLPFFPFISFSSFFSLTGGGDAPDTAILPGEEETATRRAAVRNVAACTNPRLRVFNFLQL